MENDDRQQWGATAFVFVFLGLLLLFVFLVSRKPAQDGADTPVATDAQASFWDGLRQRAPEYGTVEYNCPVDGTALDVPNRLRDNRYGGVASDFMKITLAPPAAEHGQPDLTVQEWERMPATCPTCGATFMEIDLLNLSSQMLPGGLTALKEWDLAEAAPPLAEVPPAQWTKDEQLFVRYLTHRQAGFPGTELGYAALPAAYASNFAVWYGKDYAVPSGAYYALAAARMRADLDAGLPEREGERALIMFDLGELYRLLGRPDDASAWFNNALDTGLLDEGRLAALKQLKAALESGDYSLERVEIEGLTAPPVGWYLDTMLPAINGHISEHRDDWNGMDDPAAIEQAIIQRIGERRGQ
ncbi:MAG TPA: hypothetical protein ENO21_05000 [Firmicutes bacterium]|nr:hypothetical protein [Bacillota bacterium]